MTTIEKGFTLTYEVRSMGFIKPGKAGEMDNGFKYPASVKVRVSNVVRDYDDELGEIDREEELELKIPCESNVQAGELNRALRQVKEYGLVLTFNGGLPKKYDSDYSTVTVSDKASEILEKISKMKAPANNTDKDKKAS